MARQKLVAYTELTFKYYVTVSSLVRFMSISKCVMAEH